MLYFKNLANNQGLLASIVSRAEDESFKEALLVYTFLLTSSLQAARCKANKQQASQLGKFCFRSHGVTVCTFA